MKTPPPNAYDEVLYPGYPFPQTHPDRLGTMARLFGMDPAPVEQCRVLELGCADGGNLIPMAYTLRDSQFVGVDLGARGISQGQQTVEALGLGNVELRCLDLLEAGDLGKFDYILAHGVYSWVPPQVQDRMLAICRENLTPQGVAYISYSVYPGAHTRTMIAEMLQYHARRFASPGEQIEQAQAMLAFLAAGHSGDDAYLQLLRQEVESVSGRRPESLFHDELAAFQSPVYFREFVTRASGHGLQYLGEADFFEMLEPAEAPDVTGMLCQLRDPIEKEQYLDFLKCRRFRQTLLCHAETPLKRRLDSAQMRGFYIGARRRRTKRPEEASSEHPVAKAVIVALVETWPDALSFEELAGRVRSSDEVLLCDIVLALFARGLLQLHAHKPQFARDVSEYPRASGLARLQARSGRLVTNLCHNTVRLEDDLSVRLLLALDGSRTRSALIEEMRPFAGNHVEQELDNSLKGLARMALLEA